MGEFHSSSRDVDPLEGRPIGGVAPNAWAGGSVDGAKGSVFWRLGGEARGGGGGEPASAAASASSFAAASADSDLCGNKIYGAFVLNQRVVLLLDGVAMPVPRRSTECTRRDG